jgi:hypothetical protein
LTACRVGPAGLNSNCLLIATGAYGVSAVAQMRTDTTSGCCALRTQPSFWSAWKRSERGADGWTRRMAHLIFTTSDRVPRRRAALCATDVCVGHWRRSGCLIESSVSRTPLSVATTSRAPAPARLSRELTPIIRRILLSQLTRVRMSRRNWRIERRGWSAGEISQECNGSSPVERLQRSGSGGDGISWRSDGAADGTEREQSMRCCGGAVRSRSTLHRGPRRACAAGQRCEGCP